MSELETWLNDQKSVEQVNELGYRLLYNDVLCYAQITKTPFSEYVCIRPMQLKDSIGNGAGVPIYLEFKRP